MQIFLNKSVDNVVKGVIPGVLVLGLAGWGAAYGSADIQNVPGLITMDTVSMAKDTGMEEMAEKSAEAAAAATGNYKDGTYQGAAQGYGGMIEVEVTIKDGKISAIDITAASGETPSFFSRAKTLTNTIIEKQSADVDVVSGATYSSNGIINAVKSALEKAKSGDTSKDSVSGGGLGGGAAAGGGGSTSAAAFTDGTYTDGTYTGSAKGWGGTITVKVTISGGKIASVDIVSAAGETAAYFNKAKALTATVVAKQTPNVDTVSGATYSSNGILNAIKAALNKAQTGNKTNDPIDETPTTPDTKPDTDKPSDSDNSFTPASSYKAGVYTGKATVEKFDYDINLTVYINKLGKIIGIEEASENDYDGNEDYMKMALENDSRNGKGTIVSQLEGTNCAELGTVSVDTVSGATYSSNAITAAVKNAAAQAASDETEEKPDDTDKPEEKPEDKPNESEKPSEDKGNTDDDSGKTDEPTEELPEKANGTYSGSATVEDNDGMFETGSYPITVSVTTADGKITEVTVTSSVDETNQRYMNFALNGRTRSGKTYTSIPSQLVGIKVTDISAKSVDAVSGATYSSNAILQAVKNALS